jgi:HAD superfamily hydrolase (TIGR01509 family)
MDGLLVDSERLERRVWQAAAREHGIDLSDERFATFIGHTREENDRQLAEYFGEAFDVVAFRETCHRGLRALMETEGVGLRPGAREWLEFVAGLGIPLGLATTSGATVVRERLGGLVSAFRVVVTGPDVARGKPYPDIYLEAARRLGIAPTVGLALEDSPAGARSAIAAGMAVVVVPDLVTPPPDVASAAAGVYDSLDAVREAAARSWLVAN